VRLASKAGVSKRTIDTIEASRIISLKTLVCVAKALFGEEGRHQELVAAGNPGGCAAAEAAGPAIPAPNSTPEVASDLRLQRDLFRIAEPEMSHDNPVDELKIDVGFFRARLIGLGDPTDPILCACASATVGLQLRGGNCLDNPRIFKQTGNAGMLVEYGTGQTRPSGSRPSNGLISWKASG
jgi:hypothetical protein